MPKRGSNEARQAAAHEALSAKVSVLRQWVHEGCPEGVRPPYSMNALRAWEDATLVLHRIGSPSTTNERLSPHNSTLIKDAQSLIDALKLRQHRARKRKGLPLQTQLENRSQQLVDRQRQITALTNQLVATRHSLSVSIASEKSALDRCARSEERASEMRRQLVRAGSGPLREV